MWRSTQSRWLECPPVSHRSEHACQAAWTLVSSAVVILGVSLSLCVVMLSGVGRCGDVEGGRAVW